MLIIEYQPFGFPERFGPALTRPAELRCSWADLVWAGLTVGRRSLRHTIRPDTQPYLELVVAATALYVNLQAADYRPGLWGPIDTYLCQSDGYKTLDPSEKSAISYLISLVTAKLFAAKLLAIPHLCHVDTYGSAIAEPPSLPDLAGLTSDLGWVLVNAKGRSNWLNRRVIARMKRRLSEIMWLNDQPPALLVSAASYFSGQDKRLKVYLKDPPMAKTHPRTGLTAPQTGVLGLYYHRFMALLGNEYGGEAFIESYNRRAYRIKALPEADLRLGLDEQLYQYLQAEPAPEPQTIFDYLSAVGASEQSHPAVSVGGDGVYVQLGKRWADERMHHPPRRREQ